VYDGGALLSSRKAGRRPHSEIPAALKFSSSRPKPLKKRPLSRVIRKAENFSPASSFAQSLFSIL
jgi:hypothetical protein